MTAEVVIVEWSDLIAETASESESTHEESNQRRQRLHAALADAYGATGTGILGIRGMPGFVAAKQAFLPMAHALAHLPVDQLQALTDETSLYNAGWSHGKEKLGNKAPDTAKASFYYNPVTDTPGSAQDRLDYPLSYPCNVWPDEAHLPGFAQRAKTLGCLLKDACIAVARHLDVYAASRQPNYAPNLLSSLQHTDKVKARLLYYFPLPCTSLTPETKANEPNENPDNAEDSWIGWHNDSGFLTALAGEIYVHHETGHEIDCPDPAAGLYVMDRSATSGVALQVIIPPDCVAVQVGECTQIMTGGAIQATPHCVRGCTSTGGDRTTARISLPCFVDAVPTFGLHMPLGCTRDQVLAADCSHNKVPPLAARWKDDMTFGDFLQATFAMYYNWKA